MSSVEKAGGRKKIPVCLIHFVSLPAAIMSGTSERVLCWPVVHRGRCYLFTESFQSLCSPQRVNVAAHQKEPSPH